ncbi:MAG TPA: NAD(P)H-dependent oxidoreductase [Patescibacteria group bacterium]|nr:NAD(P)H-dependent oxidoreductase [Patescibacteria group bacterium]
MENKLVIAVICGTKREGRQSIKAANWVAEIGRQQTDVEIIFVDPKDFNLPGDGNKDEASRDPRYTAITQKADAFFVVTPEYNHGYPGSLKRLLDSEYENYKHKPVALAGVSNGPWGGVRVCEALLAPMHTMGVVVIQNEMYFPKVQELFDDNGQLKAEYTETYTKAISASYKELIWMARLLKDARI